MDPDFNVDISKVIFSKRASKILIIVTVEISFQMRTEDFFTVLTFLVITKEIVADSCTEQHFKKINSKIVSIIYVQKGSIFSYTYLEHLHKITLKL